MQNEFNWVKLKLKLVQVGIVEKQRKLENVGDGKTSGEQLTSSLPLFFSTLLFLIYIQLILVYS